VNHPADREWAAAAVVRGRVKVVRKPPRVQTQRDQITRGLGEPPVGAFLQCDLDLCITILAPFDAFVRGLRNDLNGCRFLFCGSRLTKSQKATTPGMFITVATRGS
jgi:hypothetical protein